MSAVLVTTRKGLKVAVRKPDPSTKYGTLPDSHLVGTVELHIDADKLLAALAGKAITSKRRRSALAGGGVTVRAITVTHEKPDGKP